MDFISQTISPILKNGEPIVVAGVLCAFIGIGFILGKGTHKSFKAIHRRWKPKPASTKDLLE